MPAKKRNKKRLTQSCRASTEKNYRSIFLDDDVDVDVDGKGGKNEKNEKNENNAFDHSRIFSHSFERQTRTKNAQVLSFFLRFCSCFVFYIASQHESGAMDEGEVGFCRRRTGEQKNEKQGNIAP